MYQNYDRAVSKVIEYLTRNDYTSSIIYTHKRCFRLFKEYIEKKEAGYSNELVVQWLKDNAEKLSITTFKSYRLAFSRLNDVLHNREIVNTKAAYEAVQYYKHMDYWCKELLDDFLTEISVIYQAGYIYGLRVSASRFLTYLTEQGLKEPTKITHRLIFDYYQDDIYRSQKSKNQSNRNVRVFLRYLVGRDLIRDSIVSVLDPLAINRFFFIGDLPADEKDLFLQDKQTDYMTPKDFHSMAVQLDNNCLDKHRYSSTARKVFRKTWKELFVFLEANELEYSSKLALRWATHLRHYTVQWQSFRRAIRIFEQYRNNGDINPAVIYRDRKDRAQDLPEWCRKEYDNFIDEQQRKGFAASTLAMNRSSTLRFLEYLSQAGITRWVQVSPESIKCFHLSDPHSTPEARNAYGAKVRHFLEYLADHNIIPSYLQLALSNECAPRTNIINTLEDEDIAAIYDFVDQVQSGFQLRQCAMIMLGLRMGIRASDITKLKLADISWERNTISVQQDKTAKFIKLPMPTEVGNCLYRYIMQGRPFTSSEYVFINHRVPYSRLGRGACAKALKQALDNNPHGFHITRKTFASRMLCSNIKPTIIAESLGHSDNTTVMTYLATDGDSMRKCAIPLKGIKVKRGVLS